MTIEQPIPQFLAKHGITAVSDNRPAGAVVVPPRGIFFQLFEPELMACNLVKRRDVSAESTGINSPG